MAKQDAPYFRLLFFMQWTFASILGWGLGFLVSVELGYLLGVGMGWWVGRVATAFLLGLSVSISQWMVLRKYLFKAGLWIPITVSGIVIGMLVGDPASQVMRLGEFATLDYWDILGVILGFTVMGLSMGVLQWWVMRRWVFESGWWVLVTTLGMVFANAIGVGVDLMLGATGLVEWVGLTIFFSIVGGISGGITGLALVSLLQQPAAGALKL